MSESVTLTEGEPEERTRLQMLFEEEYMKPETIGFSFIVRFSKEIPPGPVLEADFWDACVEKEDEESERENSLYLWKPWNALSSVLPQYIDFWLFVENYAVLGPVDV